MTRTANNSFLDEKNSRSNRPIFLYSIYDYDGSSDLHYTNDNGNVTYDGQLYTKYEITHASISENTSGEVNKVSLTIGNASRFMQSIIESYDIRGKKVEIRLVWSNLLADTAAYLKDTFYIDSYSADQVTFNAVLAPKYDLLDLKLPRRLYNRNHCGHVFKGTECAYAGADSTCEKTQTDCRSKSNYSRYGGFPSIPYRRNFMS